MTTVDEYRFFLKDSIRKKIDFQTTDQSRGVAAPAVEKPFDPRAERFRLPEVDDWSQTIGPLDLVTAMSRRKSRRAFSASELSLDELAFLLWATQGIRDKDRKNPAFRTVPSAGARHSFETYLFIHRVAGLEPGLYRYLPVENELLFLTSVAAMADKLTAACFGQAFVAKGAVTFVWTTIAYRMEWRYAQAAHRVILIDAGHVCQNLYLACEAIGAGTCAVAAYDQEKLNQLLAVDGDEEFAVYLAPVGKIR
jgi:SagB-type dehydrogenase family enzyme